MLNAKSFNDAIVKAAQAEGLVLSRFAGLLRCQLRTIVASETVLKSAVETILYLIKTIIRSRFGGVFFNYYIILYYGNKRKKDSSKTNRYWEYKDRNYFLMNNKAFNLYTTIKTL